MKDVLIKANEVEINFKLTRKNIENYRKTFDRPTVITLMWEDDSKCWVGGDLCDILYQIWEFIEEEQIESYNLYYFNSWQVKNIQLEGNEYLDLLLAVAIAYHSVYDEDAPEIDHAVVCLENDVCFILHENFFDEEIKQEEFDKLWNS